MFYKYISAFVEKDTKLQTHLSFPRLCGNKMVGGMYSIPDDKYLQFYKKYYEALTNGEDLHIIEKVNPKAVFSYFLDIEVGKSEINFEIEKEHIELILGKCKKCIKEIANNFEIEFCDYIISRRNNKYHINFPNLIVNSNIAMLLTKILISKIEDIDIKKIIDSSVYRTGLRLFGSKKDFKSINKEKLLFDDSDADYQEVYEMYDLKNDIILPLNNFKDFMKLVIRKPNGTKCITLKEEFIKEQSKIESKSGTVTVKTQCDTQITNEIKELLNNLKDTVAKEYFEKLQIKELEILKFMSTQNKSGIYCYYMTINNSICPFKNRKHTRESSPIYIELSVSGIFIKCHDVDCMRKVYPDEGIELPDNFETKYPNLYKNMTTKYWKSEIVLTQHIKKLLEDSLTGSHYKIAKVAYNIYKDRFRIDDIKNADWYEFDGIRWIKTHIMNILISEELPKYYKAIKISDTEQACQEDLENFIQNKDKLEANLRNSLVDNIINKLENRQFKTNIITEMFYFFKTLEPNFMAKLDANPELLGFKNGIYDLDNCSFRKGNQKDYITMTTGYDFIEYDPESQEVKDIYIFLSQIIPNKQVLEYVLKVLGRSLLGYNDERFYIFTGFMGQNGKSTLINFLEHSLGDYLTSCDVSLLTNKKALSSAASPDVIRLNGRRIVTYNEPESNEEIKCSIIKTFSGGDSVIARELYKAPISFKLQATNILICNDIPELNSNDGGIFRRLRLVQFSSKFCAKPRLGKQEFKIDPKIKTKIKNWKPYFMSILLHYFKIYQDEVEKNGEIFEPNEVKLATDKYKKSNDKFNEYITECVQESNTFMSIRTIYQNFSRWWSMNYSTIRIPDIKELKKSFKIKFGDEITKNNKEGFKVNIIEEEFVQNDIEDDY
jgi:P4 family phage/plasmid primase-like protien